MPSDSNTKNSLPTNSTATNGSSPSETSSNPALQKMKDSELFNFDPATIDSATFEEICKRMEVIVIRNRKARSLLMVAEQRALEEETKKTKKKKKPLMERKL